MSLQDLCKAVETGDQDRGKDLAQKLVDGGTNPLEIIDALTKVMDEIGEKFTRLEIFLPEMMMSGEAMSKVVEILTPHLKKGGGGEPKGKVVLGTVKGDLHEIGKNIVKLMLQAGFFEIKDIGVDADPMTFIKEAQEFGADIIGASSLMTTTMPHQKEMIDILKDQGKRDKYKVVIGGAPTTVEWAEEIGADLYAPDAGSATQLLSGLLKK
ncbi:MAG: corrinoid protein [Spirochaetales bacterium]|jgi:corrinoid protein of di/trimethylamine methyltransferase|nr:corrinoid protein [Spirochaetales bacterium]